MEKPEKAKQYKVPAVEEVLASGRFIMIEDQDEEDAYWKYLCYRVQRALYEVCQENPALAGMSWRDFLLIVRHRKRVREAAMEVLCQTVDQLLLDGSPASSEIEFFQPCEMEDAEGDIFHAAVLSPNEEGRTLMELLFLRVEIACYQKMYARKDCSWEKFIGELLLGQQLWDTILHTFQDILTHLDFKAAWQAVGIDVFLETVEELCENTED